MPLTKIAGFMSLASTAILICLHSYLFSIYLYFGKSNMALSMFREEYFFKKITLSETRSVKRKKLCLILFLLAC